MSETLLDLSPETVRHDAELLVCLSGRLDVRTREHLVGWCRSWAGEGVRDVVIDLADVGAVDGFGVAALLRARKVMRARAGTLRVVNPPPGSPATLTSTGMYAGAA
jgi:anti-anti-sigma factor